MRAPVAWSAAALFTIAAVVRADPPAAATTRPAVNAHGEPRDLGTAQAHARTVSIGLALYAAEHKGRFPATLGELLKYTGLTNAGVFLTPGDARRLGSVPLHPTADWVNANASFVFLAPGVQLSRVRGAATTAVLHTSLADPIDPTAKGPVVLVGFADGHVETLPVDKAKAAVANSAKAIADAR